MPSPAAPGLKCVKGIELGAAGFEDGRRKPPGNERGSGTGNDSQLTASGKAGTSVLQLQGT